MTFRLRRYLRAALVEDGWKVNMVGTRKSGNMIDNVSLALKMAEEYHGGETYT